MAKSKSKGASAWTDNAKAMTSLKTKSSWVDNGQGLTGHSNGSWIENANEQTRLNNIINDRSSNIHRIDEDIEKLEQACRDADKAISGFSEAAKDMEMLESEVSLIFKGESAIAFLNKIDAYKNLCLSRAEHMRTLKSNYSNQIQQLRMEKIWAQDAINSLREQLAKLRRIYV